MKFPDVVLKIGNAINDPFFTLSIENYNNRTDDIKKRIKLLEKSISEKSNPKKYYELGNLYKDTFINKKAINYYKKYLKAVKSLGEEERKPYIEGDIYHKLADIDIRLNRTYNLEKAILFFNKSIEIYPDDYNLFSKIGDCYLALGRTSEALNAYNKLLEKNNKDCLILSKMQAASFQSDYIKMVNTLFKENITQINTASLSNFNYIQTAINNSSSELKESLKLQHYIYFLRLLLLKKEINNKQTNYTCSDLNLLYTDNEKNLLSEIDIFIKSLKNKNITAVKITYLKGIIDYINSKYIDAISDFEIVLKSSSFVESAQEDILYINNYCLKNYSIVKKNADYYIKTNPKPEYYLLLAGFEFNDKNMTKALMLCSQSLKIDKKYSEAYSAMSLIFAIDGNYIAADEMIKKGISYIKKCKTKKTILYNQMITNEAAISLLKKEKERAYILFKKIMSVDSNDKVSVIYNRYFRDNEKLQN